MRLDSKQKRKAMNQLRQRFSQLGIKHQLNFSSQETLRDLWMGLDGIQRKLLVLKRQDKDALHSFIIDLNHVSSCSVKKHYGTIQSGELRTKKLEQYLEKIALQFSFTNGQPPREIPFYRHFENALHESRELEQKARDWEAILSKLHAPLKKIA